MKRTIPLLPGNAYCISARTVGNERAFLDEGNYNFFLERYFELFGPYCENFAYSLMPDQFHFVIRIKQVQNRNIQKGTGIRYQNFLAKQFGNLLCSYTHAFNKSTSRKGKLFITPVKRILIPEGHYLADFIKHVHRLPVEREVCDNLDQWKFSSYPIIMNDFPSFILNTKVLNLFSSKEKFRLFHDSPDLIKSPFKTIYSPHSVNRAA